MNPTTLGTMHDFQAYRRSTIRYWERRRIVYNLALVAPAFFSFMIVGGIEAGLGGVPILSTREILRVFVVSAVGANICYTFAYALEFLFGCDAPASRWSRWGRTVALVSGILFAIVLALFGGATIAMLEFGVR